MKARISNASAAFFKVAKAQKIKISSVSGGQLASFIAINPDTLNFVGQETVRDELFHSSLKYFKDNEHNFFGTIHGNAFFIDAFGSKAFQLINFSKQANQMDFLLPGCSHRIHEAGRLGCRDLLLGAMIAAFSETQLANWIQDKELVEKALLIKKELKQGVVSSKDFRFSLMVLFRLDYVKIMDGLISQKIIPGTINLFMKTGITNKGMPKVMRTSLPENAFIELIALQDFYIGISSCPGDKKSIPKPSDILIEIE